MAARSSHVSKPNSVIRLPHYHWRFTKQLLIRSLIYHLHMTPSAEYLVTMTASIHPRVATKSFRSDPKVRLDDYKQGLRFWLAHPHPKLKQILFLENTGFDLSELQTVAQNENPFGKAVEFISMDRNLIPEGRHYGYGEMQMLDEGLPKCGLRQVTTHMIKATGRLTFLNVGKLMDKLPGQFDVMVECRLPSNAFKYSKNWAKVIRNRVGAYVSCQLMIFSHSFYEDHLQKLYFNLNPGGPGTYPNLIENLLYDRIIEFEGRPGIYLRWPLNIEPVGYAGHWQKRYDDPRRLSIRALRAVTRVLMPRLWL